jgi:CubicO group peptidase (beta-lactamase class C family)
VVRTVKSGLPMRANDRMRIASTSKAFSGAVALSLVSKGRLSLDDTIGGRLPYLPESWHEVTLRQLLDHTSGLPDFTEAPSFLEAVRASPGTWEVNPWDSARAFREVYKEDPGEWRGTPTSSPVCGTQTIRSMTQPAHGRGVGGIVL